MSVYVNDATEISESSFWNPPTLNGLECIRNSVDVYLHNNNINKHEIIYQNRLKANTQRYTVI